MCGLRVDADRPGMPVVARPGQGLVRQPEVRPRPGNADQIVPGWSAGTPGREIPALTDYPCQGLRAYGNFRYRAD